MTYSKHTRLRLRTEDPGEPSSRPPIGAAAATTAMMVPEVSGDEASVDASIVRFLQRGLHGPALGLMMSAYGERIARFFARRTRRPELVEDLAQETFIRAMQGLRGFRAEARVFTWLTRIAYNVLYTAHHRQARRDDGQARYRAARRVEEEAANPGVAVAVAVVGERPDRRLRRMEVAGAIDACLSRMNDVVRELAMLVWVEGHSFVEAASITGMSEDAVRKRLCRARPLLQRCLQGRGVVGEGEDD